MTERWIYARIKDARQLDLPAGTVWNAVCPGIILDAERVPSNTIVKVRVVDSDQVGVTEEAVPDSDRSLFAVRREPIRDRILAP